MPIDLPEIAMNHDHSVRAEHDAAPSGFWRSRYAIGLLVIGAAAAYFLMTEHQAHVFGALPLLLLLACPLMHVFMHGHHGHGHGPHPDRDGAAGRHDQETPGERP
jgi:hypothetical protein